MQRRKREMTYRGNNHARTSRGSVSGCTCRREGRKRLHGGEREKGEG